MSHLLKKLTIFAMISGLAAPTFSHADNFNINRFHIDGAHIGDSQNRFLHSMSSSFPANASRAKRTLSSSILYTKAIRCQSAGNGVSRCEGKFAEMKKPATGKQKEFIRYRDVVADFNLNNQLSFLSTITTTQHKDRKACLSALSKFYQQATKKTEKPSIIYPRNQLDIYYIKIDEKPFTTRMVGKLDSAFSMVWQKQRGDWSAFYSIDFGCRESGHMVVNKTLYDESRKKVSSSKFQVSRLKSKNM